MRASAGASAGAIHLAHRLYVTAISNLHPFSPLLPSPPTQILDQAHPRVVKLLDSFGAAAAIQAANPGIAIIGRIYLNSQPMSGDPNAVCPP